MKKNFNPNDIIGKKFNKLTVISINRYDKKYYYNCKCDCGNNHVASRANLLSGEVKSCGCLGGKALENVDDIVGNRYGMLTVLSYAYRDKGMHWYYCQCDCGNIKISSRSHLICNHDISCGCSGKVTNPEDIIGKKFNMLTVIFIDHYDKKQKQYIYRCRCDCGNETTARRSVLLNGERKSCGCLRNYNDNIDLNNIIGERFGKLVVLSYDRYEKGEHHYKCQCDCGNITTPTRGNLFSGNTKSCGCIGKIEDLNDIIGHKFGMLTVLSYDHYTPNRYHIYKCQCDCGNTRMATRQGLLKGITVNCGCINLHKTHGMSDTRFYNIWLGIKFRCYNSKSKAYKWYGEKGIKMCDRWLESFENFRDDMYPSYLEHVAIYGEKDTSIDRIDNNEDYCPENCRWSTSKVQNNNRTSNRYINYNGETLTLSQLVDKYAEDGVSYSAVKQRLDAGWSIDFALSKVDRYYNGKPIICPIRFNEKE